MRSMRLNISATQQRWVHFTCLLTLKLKIQTGKHLVCVVESEKSALCILHSKWFTDLICLVLGAGVAGCRGGAAEAEHGWPHWHPQPGEPAPGRGVRPAVPRAGDQRVRPLQGRTLPQRHAGCCLPHPGQFVLFHSTTQQGKVLYFDDVLEVIESQSTVTVACSRLQLTVAVSVCTTPPCNM